MRFYITLLLLTFIINNQILCQFLNSEVIANSEIESILYSGLGKYYYVNSFDVNLRKIDQEYYIQDKSNLLKDCFVFVAKDSLTYSTILFGVYKAGTVLWKSREFSCGKSIIFSGDIWQIRNLKPDKVYVIFQLPFIPDGYESNIWLISWDGINGSIVNEVNSEDFSTISSTTNSIKFVDIDGDGNEELLGVKVDSTIYHTEIDTSISYAGKTLYTWNGNIISDYGATLPDILPKNKFDATINTTLKFNNNTFTYKYLVANSANSIQSIQTFAIDTDIDTLIEKQVPSKWICFNSTFLMVIFTVDPFYIDDEDSKIAPGGNDISFTLLSNNLPSIEKFYLQGYNGDSNDFNNLRNNSKSGYTVVPTVIFDTLNTQSYLDTLINYCIKSFKLNWIINQNTTDKYDSLFNAAKTQLQQNNNNVVRTTLQTVLQQVNIDSTNNLTSEAYALLRYNTEYLLEQIPQSSPNLLVRLTNSQGNQIPASNVMYYEGSWKDAVNNGDGTFTVITTKPTVSIRMFYEYANQTVNNVPAQNNTYTFITVNAAVQLKNSSGNLIDEGTVQYYAGAWRNFGTTVNGVAYKELLPVNYSFRMTYEYVSIDKQQNLSENPVVDFNTVLCTIKVTNVNNQPLEGANTKYYSVAWRDIGLTDSNGEITKELLPKNLSFRATYNNVSQDKQQDISVNNLVEIMLNVP
jgi:hypothetical protein